jgi:hypothetical protein
MPYLTVGLKVNFDMALLVVASGLYRMVAHKMRGFADAQARDTPRSHRHARHGVTEKEFQVRFDHRAHLPVVLASGLLDSAVEVPWWNGMRLRLTT